MMTANCFLLPELTAGSCCCQQQYPHPLNTGALPWGVTTASVNQPCWSQGHSNPQPGAQLEDLPHLQPPDPHPGESSPGTLRPRSCPRTVLPWDLRAVLLDPGLRWSNFGGMVG